MVLIGKSSTVLKWWIFKCYKWVYQRVPCCFLSSYFLKFHFCYSCKAAKRPIFQACPWTSLRRASERGRRRGAWRRRKKQMKSGANTPKCCSFSCTCWISFEKMGEKQVKASTFWLKIWNSWTIWKHVFSRWWPWFWIVSGSTGPSCWKLNPRRFSPSKATIAHSWTWPG